MPLITSYEGDERPEQTSIDSIRHHGILAAVAVVANAVFGTLVILIGYGSEFRPAIEPMLILLPGIWFLGMGIVDPGGPLRPRPPPACPPRWPGCRRRSRSCSTSC